MSSRHTLVAAALAGAVLVSGAVGFAIAQPAPPAPQAAAQGMAPGGHPGMHHRADFRPDRHIEGRIAFLKTELKITDAQTPAFNALGDVLRAEAKARGDMHERMRERAGKPANAVERLEFRGDAMQRGAEATQRLLEVVKPLYAQLSPEQKATADELLAKSGKHRRMMRH